MAKNKRPRKAYKPGRWDEHALLIDRNDLRELEGIFQRIELITELRLPTGEFHDDDVQLLRDFKNLSTVLIYAGHHIDKQLVEKEHGVEWNRFHKAFETYYQRVIDKKTYTATGDELNAIRRGVEIGGVIIKTELRKEPYWTLRCYQWLKSKTDGTPGKIEVDMTDIEKTIRNFK